MMDVVNFTSFNFNVALQEGLNAMGFDNPTPIQKSAIPKILEGKDLIACAQTGTGKTAAFILPILHKIAESGSEDLNTLILAPTRELAIQIDQQIQGLAYFAGVSSLAIYGGGDGITWERQKKALEHGTEIIVATPGRLIALMAGGKINFSTLQHLVLDEADRMLDMGFSEDILKIINYLPKKRQTVLFSATMPANIRKFSQKILHHPEEINIAIGKTAEGVTQIAYLAYDNQKEDLLQHILNQKDFEAVIIFASTKDKVKAIFKTLKKKFDVEAFHSDLDQTEREKIMSRFKNKSLKILVGTDILSRGIDVEGIELVINYDTPGDPEDYVHRVGRTARADMKGEAITFINEKDKGKFSKIERLIGLEIPKEKLPEELGEGPEYASSHKKPKGKPSRKPDKKFSNKPQQKAKSGSSQPRKSPSNKPEGTQQKSADPQGKFRKRHNVKDMKKE